MYSENTHFNNDNSVSTSSRRSLNFRVGVSAGLGIGGLVLLCLLIINFSHLLNGSTGVVTFTAFLEWLSTFQPIFPDMSYIDYSIVADWGVFNFLRDYFNIFNSLFSVITYSFKSLLNLLSYLLNIVRFLFVGV